MTDSMPVLKGTLDLLVLKALSAGPRHGFEIAQWIEDRSDGEVEFDDSAVYHALYRMQDRGLVEADWGVTENNRRARYYSVTSEGSAYLEDESDRVLRYARTLAAILGAPTGAP